MQQNVPVPKLSLAQIRQQLKGRATKKKIAKRPKIELFSFFQGRKTEKKTKNSTINPLSTVSVPCIKSRGATAYCLKVTSPCPPLPTPMHLNSTPAVVVWSYSTPSEEWGAKEICGDPTVGTRLKVLRSHKLLKKLICCTCE